LPKILRIIKFPEGEAGAFSSVSNLLSATNRTTDVIVKKIQVIGSVLPANTGWPSTLLSLTTVASRNANFFNKTSSAFAALRRRYYAFGIGPVGVREAEYGRNSGRRFGLGDVSYNGCRLRHTEHPTPSPTASIGNHKN